MGALTCAALAAAIAGAQPGAVLTMAPGQTCTNMVLKGRSWSAPVTLNATGVTFRGLMVRDMQGFRFVGGQVEAAAGIGGTWRDGYAMQVRNSRDLQIRDVVFTNASRGLIVNGSHHVLIEGNRFHNIRSDGINLVTMNNAVVRNNDFRDFRPVQQQCDLPEGGRIQGIGRRKCQERSGKWKDGDHPDGIQMFGHELADIEISGNRIEGNLQSIGVFNNSFKDTVPTRIRINDNWARSTRTWGISLKGCVDCEVMRNDVGRTADGTAKIQINVEGSTGRFCGNKNPDAPSGHATVQPC